jgi:putative membrane protein
MSPSVTLRLARQAGGWPNTWRIDHRLLLPAFGDRLVNGVDSATPSDRGAAQIKNCQGLKKTRISYLWRMEKMADKFVLALKGAAMGIAEVIPGVSGGTIAFITGIYETLIDTIKAILGVDVINALRKEGLAAAWEKANGTFVVFLLGGMVFGVVVGVFGVTYLLENYPELLWAFFFGLIVASAVYIGVQVRKWGIPQLVGMVGGTVLAYWITIATPAEGIQAYWFIFISGAIAISALILPGISGSFILLLLGMYKFIIPTVKDALKTLNPESLIVLGVFGLGCLVGLATFSRVLSWTFKHHYNTTMAVLTGFMIGSLNKIWPWRNVLETRINSKGEEVPFLEESVLPGAYNGDPQVFGVIVLMIVGLAAVFLLDRISKR